MFSKLEPPRRKSSLADLRLPSPSDEAFRLAVWAKGSEIPGHDSRVIRRDAMGSLMLFGHYGDRSSRFGWEVDHFVPRAANGSSDLSNLRPLQWENNCKKGDQIVRRKPRWWLYYLDQQILENLAANRTLARIAR